MEQISRVTGRREKVSETVRRGTALSALFSRVRYHWVVKGLPVMPAASTLIESAVYHRILAVWDYDGTPVPQSYMDEWSLDSSSILDEPQTHGAIGPLHMGVVEACSVA